MPSPTPGTSGIRPVTLALGMGALLAISAFAAPAVRDTIFRARAEQTAAALREFRALLHEHATTIGDWPSGSGAPGEPPAGMETRLVGSAWTKPAPIGGHYAWDPNSRHRGTRHRAAITIAGTPDTPVSSDRRQLEILDQILDDGNLATGALQLGYRNQPLFILEH